MQSKKPIILLRKLSGRQTSSKALQQNIKAINHVANLLRSTLGPNAMMKMIVNQMGTVITNDGNHVLRDVGFAQPAARFVVELSQTQEQDCGDGTTSVILFCAELLTLLEPLLTEKQFHPNECTEGLQKFLKIALEELEALSTNLNFKTTLSSVRDTKDLKTSTPLVEAALKTALNSKTVSGAEDLVISIALEAFQVISGILDSSPSSSQQSIPRNWKELVKLEKFGGGRLEDSYVHRGVILSKEPITSNMPVSLLSPKVLVVEGGLEYAKTSSHTELELKATEDLEKLIDQEEAYIKKVCAAIVSSGASLVFTRGGTSLISEYFLGRSGVAVFRRLNGPQLERVCKSTGAVPVSTAELFDVGQALQNAKEEEDEGLSSLKRRLGKGCVKYELKRLNDEFFSFFECDEHSRSCSVVLRGASKSEMKEIEGNLDDALGVFMALWRKEKVLPEGGATEIAMNRRIQERIEEEKDERIRKVMEKAAEALLVVPKILAENCGEVAVKKMEECLRRNTETGKESFGINGVYGDVEDCMEEGVVDAFSVKESVIKTGVNSAMMILRIGDVLSGLSNLEKE